MSKFEDSEWKNRKSAKEFIEKADHYILERRRLFKIMKSLYKHFLANNRNKTIKVLDLGCGDGILTQELLKVNKDFEGTLIDGSAEMLKNAELRLKSDLQMEFIHETFQELVKNNLNNRYDFVVSSLAIHHLSMEQKETLFRYIYNHINEGGFFLNIDTIKAPSDDLEEWYLTLWKEWIIEKERKNEVIENFKYIPNQYKNNPDNNPDTLEKQLNSLKSIGFKNVDCYYKYGIFSIYGGQK